MRRDGYVLLAASNEFNVVSPLEQLMNVHFVLKFFHVDHFEFLVTDALG